MICVLGDASIWPMQGIIIHSRLELDKESLILLSFFHCHNRKEILEVCVERARK
jgi:hypothetical protein